MARGSKASSPDTPSEHLESLINQSTKIVKTARRHKVNLSGDNYYANKLASLRADATNMYRNLPPVTAGDSSAIAELVGHVFHPDTRKKDRDTAARDAIYSLRTTWRQTGKSAREDSGLFPLSILNQANRGYLVSIASQMNACFSGGLYDASAVMMRRLLEVAIIEAFEGKGIASKIKDSSGDFYQLSELISKALKEKSWNLSRNCKRALPKLKAAGHKSAHGRYFLARSEDLERIRSECRIVVEEFLHLSGLLK